MSGRPMGVRLTQHVRREIRKALHDARDDLVFEYETGGLLVASLADRPELLGITVVDALNDVVDESWHWGQSWNPDRIDEHIAALKERPGIEQVCGSWHTHPGPEEGASEPSTQDITAALRLWRDVADASHVHRTTREWWVELIVTPARPISDPLEPFAYPAYHPWLIGPPLEEGGEPRVIRAELL